MNNNQCWDATLYDSKHSFVSMHGGELVNLLSPQSSQKILDLGCGTGDLTKNIAESGAEIIGIDESSEMIDLATSKYPEIKFEVMDALDITYENYFDSVFSNAALHWILEPKELLCSVYKSLKTKGKLVVEFGGKNNCIKITTAIIEEICEAGYEYDLSNFPWYFPSIGEYSSLLESEGFDVSYALHYERPTKLDGDKGLKNWITMFGEKLINGIPENDREKIIEKVVMKLDKDLMQNGVCYADYKRIRIVAVKY